jgi:hypothetical protein
MRRIWKYEREPTSEERLWYAFFYGKRCTNQFFMELRQNRHKIMNMQEGSKDVKNLIKNAHAHYQLLNAKEYEQITKDYKFITNAFLELVYPKFMQEMYKRES